MTKNKLWLVPLMGLALGGCTYVQGLMDPSINVNADTPIEVASLGNDAGIYGAAYVALQAAEA